MFLHENEMIFSCHGKMLYMYILLLHESKNLPHQYSCHVWKGFTYNVRDKKFVFAILQEYEFESHCCILKILEYMIGNEQFHLPSKTNYYLFTICSLWDQITLCNKQLSSLWVTQRLFFCLGQNCLIFIQSFISVSSESLYWHIRFHVLRSWHYVSDKFLLSLSDLIKHSAIKLTFLCPWLYLMSRCMQE